MTIGNQAPFLLEQAGSGEHIRGISTAIRMGLDDTVRRRLEEMSDQQSLRDHAFKLGEHALSLLDEKGRGFGSGNPAALGIAFHAVGTVEEDLLPETTTDDGARYLADLTYDTAEFSEKFDDALQALLAREDEPQQASFDEEESGGVALYDDEEQGEQTKRINTRSFLRARTLERLNELYDLHPYKNEPEVIAAYNAIIVSRVLDSLVPFRDSERYYGSLRRVGAGQDQELGGEMDDGVEGEEFEKLHLALDRKFLARAAEYTMEKNYHMLRELLGSYGLKTSPQDPSFMSLRVQLEKYAYLASEGQFDEVEPQEFIEDKHKYIKYDKYSKLLKDEDLSVGDYSDVKLDLVALGSAEAPVFLRDLYGQIFTEIDDADQAKQVFIATVLEMMVERGVQSNYADIYTLSKLVDYVDDADLIKDVARRHDSFLIAFARKLDADDDHITLYKLLSATRFLLEDGHPTVEAGRKLFLKAYEHMRQEG